jgi:hypothetical protein
VTLAKPHTQLTDFLNFMTETLDIQFASHWLISGDISFRKLYVETEQNWKSSIFWDITPRGSLKVNRRTKGTITSFFRAYSACYLLHAGSLLCLSFDPEDGDTFFRNVG